jgi:Bacterial lectin
MQSGTVPMGDGMTFIIQGNTPTAIPPQTGGGLGYGPDTVGGTGGIPNSIAIKFDTFNNQGEGNNSTGLFVDGHAPTIPTDSRDTLVKIDPSVINLTSGDPMRVELTYDGTTLTETITDTITTKTFTTTYAVNIPGYVGGNVGYVGFGAGTGGNTALQDISAWIYTTPFSPPSPAGSGGGAAAVVAGPPPEASSNGPVGLPTDPPAPSGSAGSAAPALAIGSVHPGHRRARQLARHATRARTASHTALSHAAVDEILRSYPTRRLASQKAAKIHSLLL